jgi:uncharacterized protein involved in exopolysaccharide biosynthesis
MKDFLLYLSIIYKRLWLILLLVAATVGTILLISYKDPPVYVAWVRFRVNAPPPIDVSLFSGFSNRSSADEILATRAGFVEILTSSAVAWQVIDRLQLPLEARELMERIAVEEVVQKELQSQAQLMRVGVKSEDPEQSALLTNALIEVALKEYGKIRATPKTTAHDFISSQLQRTAEELQQAQQKLIAFQIENKIGDLPQAISLQQQLIYGLIESRDQAQAKGDLQQVAIYDELILQRQVELQDLIDLGSEYAKLEAAVTQSKSTNDFLLEKETEATLKENETLTVSFIQVIAPAEPPSSPLPQVQSAIIGLGVVVSLVAGIILAFIWHYLETGAQSLLTNMDSKTHASKPTPETS